MSPSEVLSITREPSTLLEMASKKNEVEESWTAQGLPKAKVRDQDNVWGYIHGGSHIRK